MSDLDTIRATIAAYDALVERAAMIVQKGQFYERITWPDPTFCGLRRVEINEYRAILTWRDDDHDQPECVAAFPVDLLAFDAAVLKAYLESRGEQRAREFAKEAEERGRRQYEQLKKRFEP